MEGISMPAVQFKDRDSYKKAFKVLMQVGGEFQGRGTDTLIVSEEQHQALVQANLVSINGREEPSRGERTADPSDV
jgi:hypothetical protein